jgi:hypothetical protein
MNNRGMNLCSFKHTSYFSTRKTISLPEINLYVKLPPYSLKIYLRSISCGILTSAKLHLTVVSQLPILLSTTMENSVLARKGCVPSNGKILKTYKAKGNGKSENILKRRLRDWQKELKCSIREDKNKHVLFFKTDM